ncbi:NADP-dependent oxidoreductase domain-containing protein [Penicillium chermesinum]|uniref:NADP-dependent oxidoreductase domain-containing protein n=1 Tax=Penicillium chermesinum TaxID=63820 RepID=A0A9W9TLR5_9EURO|nr:NADP-dependent oxidoreductase domain-containing protein [Penicillium chermesinum]KAJ5225770.1 NADP-dependent oxidoreductase domain-containing protein [Penicillium chermesinum]
MSRPTRTLGVNGPTLPAIGLGLMSIGGLYGDPGPKEERLAFLEHAHSSRQRFWDTADAYGDCEDVVGEWFHRSGKREDIFLATKFGFIRGPNGVSVDSSPEYVRAACEKSLQRLGVDKIDLYFCHRVDGITPVEKTIEAMVALKNEGKIRYLGISEVSAATLRRAHAVHPITALQIEYSPFATDIESPKVDLLNTCLPIGRGLLAGKFKSAADIPDNDFRKKLPKYSAGNFPKILELVRGFEDVANAHQTTPAKVSLAWVLAQGPDIIPIPGTTSVQRMDENASASSLILTDDEIRTLRILVDKSTVPGNRYMDGFEESTLGDTPPL